MNNKLILPGVLAVALAACGGGGSGNAGGAGGGNTSGGNNTNGGNNGGTLGPLQAVEGWSSMMRSNPESLNQEQRKAAYWGAALAEYRGNLDPAEISYKNAYEMWLLANEYLGDNFLAPVAYYGEALALLGVEAYDWLEVDDTTQQEVQVSDQVYCSESGQRFLTIDETAGGEGTLFISGELDEGVGTVRVELNDCALRDSRYTGSVFAEIEPQYLLFNDRTSLIYTDGVQYFNELTGNSGSAEYSVSGFFENRETFDEDGVDERYTFSSLVYTDAQNDVSVLRRIEKVSNAVGGVHALNGALASNTMGSVLVDYERHPAPESGPNRMDYVYKTLTLTGADSTRTDISTTRYGEYVLMEMDEDGDGQLDVGHFFLAPHSRSTADASLPRFGDEIVGGEQSFIPVSQLNYPPVILDRQSWVIFPSPEYGAEIQSLEGDYFDNETPLDELQVSIIWRINGEEVVAARNSLTLAAEYIEFGDSVTVVIGVSDGQTTVFSPEFGEIIF